MIDSIESRLAVVAAATAQAATSQAAYVVALANANALGVAAQIDANAVLAARQSVRAGLVVLGQAAYIQAADGTESVVELGGADYTIRSAFDASAPLPASP